MRKFNNLPKKSVKNTVNTKSNNSAYAQIQRDYDGKYDSDFDYADIIPMKIRGIRIA